MNTDIASIIAVLTILLDSVESGKISKRKLEVCKQEIGFLSQKYRAGINVAERERFDRHISDS